MESRLLHAGCVALPRPCLVVPSTRNGVSYQQSRQAFRVAAQKFMKSMTSRHGTSVLRGEKRKHSRSVGVVVACQRPDQGNANLRIFLAIQMIFLNVLVL